MYLRTRKLLKTNLCCRNLIKVINIWTVSLVRYYVPFLKLTREEHRHMDYSTRNLMSMHKALHPRIYIDRLFVTRHRRGRELGSIEDCVDAAKTLRLIKAANSSNINRNNLRKTGKQIFKKSRKHKRAPTPKKTNCMDTFSDKLRRFPMRLPG